MNALLSECQQWLANRYASAGISFDQDNSPRWRVVARDNLTDSTPIDEQTAGVVEDGEIGLLLYLLPLAEKAKSIVEQVTADINLALTIRSRLLPQYSDSGSDTLNETSDDLLGTWRVCLHWLVPTRREIEWRDAVMHARQQSSAFDEVAVDGIFVSHGESVRVALDRHGLPRLLLSTRQVFVLGASEVENWKSADEDVRGALAGFGNGFSRPTEKAVAVEIEQKADAYAAGRASPTEQNPTELKSVEIANFRSIDRLRLDGSPGRDGDHKAHTWIVFGPNGTGKTSLAEAISIAMEGSSTRFRSFLNNRDVVKEKSAKGYIQNYLTPRTGSRRGAVPEIAINAFGMVPVSQRLVGNMEEANAAQARLDGAVSDQEESREFARLSSDDLATRVAGSFSTLARELAAHLDNGYDTAHAKRSAFNKEFGLNAIAKKRETIFARIGERKLAEALARPAAGLLDYLRVRSKLGGDEGRTAETVLAEWENMETALRSQGEMLAQLAALGGANEKNLVEAVRPFVNGFAKRLTQTRALLQSLKEQADHAGELPDLLQSIHAWAEWLARPAARGGGAAIGSAEPLNRRLVEMLMARNKIEAEGQTARKRLDHLIAALEYVTLWEKEYPDTCPTCASQLADRGGIRKVAEELRDEVEARLGKIREEYQTRSQEIRSIEAQLKALGQDQCPVPEPIRNLLNDILSRVAGQPFDASTWLGVPERRDILERLFAHLATPPAEPAEMSPEVQAKMVTDISASIAIKWLEAEQIAEEPDAWESVRKTFQDLTQRIIAAHLPNTLERVWWEIAASLTSAPWLLPEPRPHFQLEIRRGDQRVYLTAGENTLVHYLLNNAEQHILGLAWTFTRFMVDSRFRHAWLLLDDPAQEMDQPAFRELTRFLATLLRLHEHAKRPFTLLLLLHQEERALDAARETDSGLYMLGWTNRQNEFDREPNTVRRMRINGPGFHSPQASLLFDRIATENLSAQ